MGSATTARRARCFRSRAFTRAATATSIVVALALGLGVAGTALAATSSSPLTPTDLRALDASFKAQQDALKQRQALELARLDAYWAQKAADRQAAATTEQAGIQAEQDTAVAPVLANRDARLADAEARRQAARAAVTAKYAAKRAEKQAWVAQHSNDMPPNPKPLSYDQALIVKAQMDAMRKAEQATIDAAKKAALDPLSAQYSAAKAQAAVDRKAFVNDQKAAAAALAATYAQHVDATKNELMSRLAQLATEADALKAQYRATSADMTAQSKTELAALKTAGQSTTAAAADWKARLTELSALYKQQSSALSDQVSATKDATSFQLGLLKDDYDAQVKYQSNVDKAQLDKFDADTDSSLLGLTTTIKATEASFKEQKDDIDAVYKVKTAVALQDPLVFGPALQGILTLVDRQENDAIRLTEDSAAGERSIIGVQATNQVVLVQAPFQRRLQDSAARLDSDLVSFEAEHKDALSSLQRRHMRETLLATTSYQILRTKAQAYVKSADAGTTPLDNFYDPATDAGSLFNVARTIGADHTSFTGAGVKVALLDTGVAPVDGLAQANVTLGPDFSFEDLDPDAQGIDTNGHGTHLAGIIAGSDDAWLAGNHTRVASRSLGIAPDANLVAIKAATADGSTDVSQVIAGINWVIRYNQANPTSPIRVLNLAYGTDSEQDYTVDPLSYAVERAWKAGIVVVVAAGNDGWDSSHLTNPGRDPYVIAVGASQAAGDKAVAAAYSSEGSADRGVDVLAPGRSLVSLRNPGSFSDTINGQGRAGDRLVRGSGTSQATAVVSGAVALLLQQRPNLTPDQVKTLLMSTAKAVPNSDPLQSGSGVLDIGHALGQGTIYTMPQAWTPSDGSGSLEAARGSSHLVDDQGTPLVGEADVFGNSYAADGWATDEWTGRSWRDAGWTGRSWRGDDWTGRSWRTDDWYGRSWRDTDWVGRSWRDYDFTGRSWRTDVFTGRSWRADRWQGRSWRDSGWEGRSWRSDGWEGRSWRGFGAF